MPASPDFSLDAFARRHGDGTAPLQHASGSRVDPHVIHNREVAEEFVHRVQHRAGESVLVVIGHRRNEANVHEILCKYWGASTLAHTQLQSPFLASLSR